MRIGYKTSNQLKTFKDLFAFRNCPQSFSATQRFFFYELHGLPEASRIMARTFILAVVLLSVVSSSAAVGVPAPAGATVPVATPCPNSPANTPTNSCFNNGGTTHVCCINPDSCGEKDASGGATCTNGNYVIFTPPTFTLIDGGAACPSCSGVPSNACFSSTGSQKVCCINPSSCSSTTPTCSNNAYVTFTGTAANPVPFNC